MARISGDTAHAGEAGRGIPEWSPDPEEAEQYDGPVPAGPAAQKALVGHLGSRFGKVSWLLATARRNDFVPFFSVDGHSK